MYIKLPFFTKFYDIAYILYYNSLSFTTCDIHVEDICLVKSGFELFNALKHSHFEIPAEMQAFGILK